MDEQVVIELLRMAETQGMQSMYRWVKNRSGELNDRSLIESIYFALKQKSVGAAYMFAMVLPREGTPDKLKNELRSARSESPGLWVTGVAHILSPPILNHARQALRAGDTLCGIQRHYCAGAGPTAVVFTSSTDFEKHLRSTRPGDDFMLVSVQQLSEQGVLLEPTIDRIGEYLALNPRNEVLLLNTNAQPPTVEVIWDGRKDEESLDPFFQPTSGLFAVPFTWEQEFFVDAKVPNEKGAVPLGGAY
jgi:hypothetical protein